MLELIAGDGFCFSIWATDEAIFANFRLSALFGPRAGAATGVQASHGGSIVLVFKNSRIQMISFGFSLGGGPTCYHESSEAREQTYTTWPSGFQVLAKGKHF